MKLKSTKQRIFRMPNPDFADEKWIKKYMRVLIPHPVTKKGNRGQVCIVNKASIETEA